MRWRTRGAILAQPHPEGPSVHAIPKQIESKQSVVAQVARREPCWLRRQAKQPSQAQSLQPHWRVLFGARIDIERKTDGADDAPSDLGFVAVDPRLLPWCAQAHPNEIGTELVELLDDRRFIFGLKIAVTRADNLGLRVLRLKRRSQLGHAFRRTTQKIMADRR